jgi:hypothetical protein
MKAKLVVIGAIFLLGLSLVAAGCGGAVPDGSTTTSPSSSTTATVLSTTTTGPTSSTVPGSTTSLPASSTSVTSTTIPPTTTTTRASTSTTSPTSSTSTTSTTAALDSGITGLVTLGPISPVERPGVPNERPYAATIIVKRTDGSVVAQVRSGEDGRFTIKLPPGAYVLEPQNGQPLPRAEAQQVTVLPHAFTEVTVAFDSGIR